MNDILELLKTFATPIAGFFAVLTAYKFGAIQAEIGKRQAKTSRRAAKTARNKLKLELFDRRLVIYNAAISIFVKLSTTGRLTSDDEQAYLVGTNGVHWLFKTDVVEFLEKTLRRQIIELALLHSELLDTNEPLAREAIAQRKMEALHEILAQREMLDQMMEPYLKLGI